MYKTVKHYLCDIGWN